LQGEGRHALGHDSVEVGLKRLEGKVAMENESTAQERRLPLVTRVYGLLTLLSGIITLPAMVLYTIYAIHEGMKQGMVVDAISLAFILSCAQVVVLLINMVCMMVLGVSLLRSRRKHAARWAYALIPLTIIEWLLSLALQGLGSNLIATSVKLCILVALSVSLDPGLLEERRLQHTLRRMEDRDQYETALSQGMLGRDMSGKGYIALDFFNLFWLFMVGSVVGLLIETVYHFAIFGEYQDRAGLLWGPFSPIYGFGAVILTVCLNRLWRMNIVLVFCASAVIGGAFEFAVSWIMEVTFGITAWDYTGQWLSIDGRTSGKYMVFWGVLGVAWVKYALPHLLALIQRIPWKRRYTLTVICLVAMLVNAGMTLMALNSWYDRMSGGPQNTPVAQFFERHFDDEYMQERFQTMHIDPGKTGRIDEDAKRFYFTNNDGRWPF